MRVQILEEGCEPYKKHANDAGWDLIAAESCQLVPNIPRKVRTGVRIAVPEGHMGLVVPRSSTGINGINLANTVGVIDSDYRGEVFVFIRNTNKMPRTLHEGDRFAQLVIVPISLETLEIVKDLDTTERGSGGFGSTGTTVQVVNVAEKKLSIKEKIKLSKGDNK